MSPPRKRIAVIGSGSAGLASAYFLNRQHGGVLEWAGASLDTVFAQRANAASPAFRRMLWDILHFNRNAGRFPHWPRRTALTLGSQCSRQAPARASAAPTACRCRAAAPVSNAATTDDKDPYDE